MTESELGLRVAVRRYRMLSAGLGALLLAMVWVSCTRQAESREPKARFHSVIPGFQEQEENPVSHEQDIRAERFVLVDSLGHTRLILRAGGDDVDAALVIEDQRGREVMRLGGPQVRPARGPS